MKKFFTKTLLALALVLISGNVWGDETISLAFSISGHGLNATAKVTPTSGDNFDPGYTSIWTMIGKKDGINYIEEIVFQY